MGRSTLALAAACAAVLHPASAQPNQELTIAGTVVNQATGAPVRNARVWLDISTAATQTDSGGRFRIAHLPAGRDALHAAKDGFEDAEDALDLTASREGIVLRLTPLSSIRGRILDTEGDPVEGATVIALTSQIVEGRRRYLMVGQAVTDDRGQYRIGQLVGGRYLVEAAGFQQLSFGDDTATVKNREAFAPVYFGDARDRASATPLSIEGGAEARADIRVNFQTGHLIRGAISGMKPYSRPTLQLRRGQEDFGLNRCTLEYGTGRFEINDVPDGSYHLRVFGVGSDDEPVFAEQEIEVAGRDVRGVSLALRPGVTVRGTVRVESSPAESSLGIAHGFSLWLEPDEDFAGPAGRGQLGEPDDNGAFEIASVPPGKYRVLGVFGGDDRFYVSSARSGTTDLLANPELEVSQATPEIQIALRTDSGAVQGAIPPELVREGEIGLVLVPESLHRPPRVSSAEEGSFEFAAVPPGVYRLHAWKDLGPIEYQSPELLRILATSGTRVEVPPGKRVTVQLKQLSETPR